MSGNTSTDILIAGAFAAFTVDLLVYPLDTLKTRIQSPDYARLFTNPQTNAVNKNLFRGLYQGVGSVIIATLPSSGAFFTTYEGTKSFLSSLNPTSSSSPNGIVPQPLIHSASSAFAELVSCAILTPAEVIKQNAQMVDKSQKLSSTNATLQTLSKFRSNPFALWRGYMALAGRNLPFTALQFPLFERAKEGIKTYRDEKGIRTNTALESGLITAVAAGSAGSFAAVLTTPIDVVKTRIMLAAVEDSVQSASSSKSSSNATRPGGAQSQGGHGLVDALGNTAVKSKEGVVEIVKEVATGSKKRKSSMMIAREIVRDEGWKGLWRGGALRGVWTMLGSGLYLGVYEAGRIYLAKRRGEGIEEEDIL